MADIEEINRRAREVIRKRQERDAAIPLAEFASTRSTELHLRWKQVEKLALAAQAAVDAYADRFGSIVGEGNLTGPIDEQMLALKAALPK